MLTQELVKELFDYKDGILINKINRSNNALSKSKAGSIDIQRGYVKIGINNKNYYLHRVIWLWHFGYIPKVIDHINGNRSDNRIENLRDVNTQENTKNSSLRKDNKSGYVGVQWYPSRNKWVAYININKKRKTIGYFVNKKDAIKTRLNYAKNNNYHPNHGKIK